MKNYQLLFISSSSLLIRYRQPLSNRHGGGGEKILLRQPDEIISLHNPEKPKGEKGSATDDGKFIKHFIGIVRHKSW